MLMICTHIVTVAQLHTLVCYALGLQKKKIMLPMRFINEKSGLALNSVILVPLFVCNKNEKGVRLHVCVR